MKCAYQREAVCSSLPKNTAAKLHAPGKNDAAGTLITVEQLDTISESKQTKVRHQPADSLRSNGARIANQQHSNGKIKSEPSDLGMDGSVTITPGVAVSATTISSSSKSSRSCPLPCTLCESDLPLAHGMLIRMRHQGTPLCFGLDHYVRKQGWTHNSLSQSICQSQSLMSVQVVQRKVRVNTLSAFYARRNPSKMSEAAHILAHPTRTTKQLLDALRRKYGAFPADELSEHDVVRLRCTMSGTCLKLTRPGNISGARLVACTEAADSGGSLFALEPVRKADRDTNGKAPTTGGSSSGFRLRDLDSGAVVTVLEDGGIGLADDVPTAPPDPNAVFEIVMVMSPTNATPLQPFAEGRKRGDLLALSEIRFHGDDDCTSYMASSWAQDAPLAASAFGFSSGDRVDLEDSGNEPQHETEISQQPSPAENASDDWQVITMTKAMQDEAGAVSAWEYQRRWPVGGWLPLMLRSDPPAWTDETFAAYAPLTSFTLPKETAGTCWVWVGDWAVDMAMRGHGAPAVGCSSQHVPDAVDADGWAYALAPHAPYGYDYATDTKQRFSLRRRKWSRKRERRPVPDTQTATLGPRASVGSVFRGLSKGFGLLRHGVAVGWKTVSLGHKVDEPDANLNSRRGASVGREAKERKDVTQRSASARFMSARNRASVAQDKQNFANVDTAVECECFSSENAELHDNADRDPSRRALDTVTAIQPAAKIDVVACSRGSNERPVDVGHAISKAVTDTRSQQLGTQAQQMLDEARYPEAVALLNRWIACYSTDPSAVAELPRIYSLRSEAHIGAGQLAKALTDANCCIVLQPESSAGHRCKGQVLLRMRQFGQATAALKKAKLLLADQCDDLLDRLLKQSRNALNTR